jgi:2-desacetyl-2-hydroxyethyl bacteriochlorophyllide A dehydrogenase
MADTMRAALCREAGRVIVEEAPRPVPGPGEVLVRVRSCGICGSDLHWYHGQMMVPPVCPGHEIAGEVADAGAGVTTLAAGDRVAVEGIASCGGCDACTRGDYHLCPRLGIVGMTIPGGFADYLVMPARHCFRVPDGVPFPTAALCEPLAVAVHGVRIAGLEIGQRVAVLGAGTIGLMAVIAARAGGAGEVVVTARRPHQRAAALALGADRVVGEDEPVDGADLVVETVGGTADTLHAAVAACRPGGTVCVLGVYTGSPTFPAVLALLKEIRILGSFVYSRAGARADFDIALDILRRRTAAIGDTHRFALPDVDAAFHAAADKTTGSIKVSIDV